MNAEPDAIVEYQGVSDDLTLSLSKVIYVLAGMFASLYFVDKFAVHLMSKIFRTDYTRSLFDAWFLYLGLCCVAAPIIGATFFSPVKSLFSWPTHNSTRSPDKFVQVLCGVAGGLLASLLAAPLPKGLSEGVIWDLASRLAGDDSYYLFFPFLVLLGIVASVATELFFRGVVFRVLVVSANLTSAIVASSLLSAYMWSFDRPLAVLIFGVISGLLFYRTRNLLASILANTLFLLTNDLSCAIFHRATQKFH